MPLIRGFSQSARGGCRAMAAHGCTPTRPVTRSASYRGHPGLRRSTPGTASGPAAAVTDQGSAPEARAARVPLATIAGQWARMGAIGFGGPPAHIVLLRKLCVDKREWLSAGEFEDGIAATNLLPGPASTQLAIFCAWRLRGAIGAVLGGVCFIAPGLAIILALSALFLSGHPPLWVRGAAAGAGAAVPAVAMHAAVSL